VGNKSSAGRILLAQADFTRVDVVRAARPSAPKVRLLTIFEGRRMFIAFEPFQDVSGPVGTQLLKA